MGLKFERNRRKPDVRYRPERSIADSGDNSMACDPDRYQANQVVSRFALLTHTRVLVRPATDHRFHLRVNRGLSSMNCSLFPRTAICWKSSEYRSDRQATISKVTRTLPWHWCGSRAGSPEPPTHRAYWSRSLGLSKFIQSPLA